jgi:hypothetical protein
VEELFDQAGYTIRQWERIERDVLETEVDVPEEMLPPHLLEAVKTAPEATTYQFVVVAAPLSENAVGRSDGQAPAATTDLRPLWRLEQRAEELEDRVPALETELADKDRSLNETRRALERATNNRGFRALERMRSFLERIAPGGTVRRRTLMAIMRPVLHLLGGARDPRES